MGLSVLYGANCKLPVILVTIINMRIRSMLSKTTLPVVLLTIIMLFACNSAFVVADEKKPLSSESRAGQTGRLLVPAAPNQSIVRGTVSAYCVVSARLLGIEPEQTIYKITMLVEASEAVKDSADFARDKQGQDIELLTKVKPEEKLFGKKIKAVVFYRGDERGGSFWIRNLEVIK